MDPNAALIRLRDLVHESDTVAEDDHFNAHRLLEELAVVAMGLDEWLTKGGFLPGSWARKPSSKPDADDFDGFLTQLATLWGCTRFDAADHLVELVVGRIDAGDEEG